MAASSKPSALSPADLEDLLVALCWACVNQATISFSAMDVAISPSSFGGTPLYLYEVRVIPLITPTTRGAVCFPYLLPDETPSELLEVCLIAGYWRRDVFLPSGTVSLSPCLRQFTTDPTAWAVRDHLYLLLAWACERSAKICFIEDTKQPGTYFCKAKCLDASGGSVIATLPYSFTDIEAAPSFVKLVLDRLKTTYNKVPSVPDDVSCPQPLTLTANQKEILGIMVRQWDTIRFNDQVRPMMCQLLISGGSVPLEDVRVLEVQGFIELVEGSVDGPLWGVTQKGIDEEV